jgi:predicted transcriptional regulator
MANAMKFYRTTTEIFKYVKGVFIIYYIINTKKADKTNIVKEVNLNWKTE